MINKKIWLIVFVVAIASVAFYFSGTKQGGKEEAAAVPAAASNGGFYIGSVYATIVNYNGKSFSPSPASIPVGGAVIFKNDSKGKMRVASGPYPSHSGYPEKSGCDGSAFDSCADIPPGVSWSFTFMYPGHWTYNNDLNPSQSGTVIVQ